MKIKVVVAIVKDGSFTLPYVGNDREAARQAALKANPREGASIVFYDKEVDLEVASPVNGIALHSFGTLPDGVSYLETHCVDWKGYRGLPGVVSFNGLTYGKSGWDSSQAKAVYRTDKAVAIVAD